jgi:hypothetical protein
VGLKYTKYELAREDVMLDRPATDAQTIIETIVRKELPAGSVHAVYVTPDPYDGGEDYLRVLVEVDDDFGESHVKKALGLVGHIRPKLIEAGETRFPVLRYLSKADTEMLRRADAEMLRREAG